MNLSTIDSCTWIPGCGSLISGGCDIRFVFVKSNALHIAAHPIDSLEETNGSVAIISQPPMSPSVLVCFYQS
jgi:hypothetical protein